MVWPLVFLGRGVMGFGRLLARFRLVRESAEPLVREPRARREPALSRSPRLGREAADVEPLGPARPVPGNSAKRSKPYQKP